MMPKVAMHLIEMVALVEMAEDQKLEQQAERQRRRQRQHQRGKKMPGQRIEVDGEIGAQHVLHAMREIDEVHHAEHQRQAGRDQEQQTPNCRPLSTER